MLPFLEFQFSQLYAWSAMAPSGFYVSRANPTQFLTGQSKEIDVMGNGFVGNVKILINGVYIPAFFVSQNMVKFILPYISAGTYDIVVVNGTNGHWVLRQVLTITDPVGTHADLGSAGRPMVLPPIVIESPGSASVNTAAVTRKATSAANVYPSVSTGQSTAYMPWDSSVVPTEPVAITKVQNSPGLNNVLVTPWGTFTNE